ncbi:MAG: hypothetical protein A2Y33_03265 [Spirochaetes bacterium GWF1_51_8]|nr:MAG: hypothetical protein A2Y33_03265 [Spirochaetes bacterium GWF1_51_8]
MNTKLRYARISDAPYLAAIRAEGFDPAEDFDDKKTLIEKLLRGWIMSGRSVIVFEQGEQTIGYAAYYDEVDPENMDSMKTHLYEFYIRPGYNLPGVPEAVFAELAGNYLPKQSSLVIDISEADNEGFRFWERQGFKPSIIRMEMSPGKE